MYWAQLRKFREGKNLSQKQMALELEVSERTYQRIEKGEGNIDSNLLLILKRKFHVNIDWLFNEQDVGYGASNTPEMACTPPILLHPDDSNDESIELIVGKKSYNFRNFRKNNLIYLNVINIKASAGRPSIVSELSNYEIEIEGIIPFPADLLYPNNGKNSLLVKVRGDSMTPLIYHGDYVCFAINSIEGDGIYMIRYFDTLLVKRLQFGLDGTILISSENPRYEKMPASQDDGFQIMGRVTAWLHRHLY